VPFFGAAGGPDAPTRLHSDDPIDAAPMWGDDVTPLPQEPTTDLFDQDLGSGSPVAWTPPDDRQA